MEFFDLEAEDDEESLSGDAENEEETSCSDSSFINDQAIENNVNYLALNQSPRPGPSRGLVESEVRDEGSNIFSDVSSFGGSPTAMDQGQFIFIKTMVCLNIKPHTNTIFWLDLPHQHVVPYDGE